MKCRKYTKEILEPLVKDSLSVAEVMRKLGKAQCGGIASYIAKVISNFGIDTSHFLGRAVHSGHRHKRLNKMSWQELLVLRRMGDRREDSLRLRRALIESGRPYECALCHQGSQWKNKELRLQVDHIDRNWFDNRPENLRFLCPNCHSQTDGYGGSKGLTDLMSNARRGRFNRAKRKCLLQESC